MNIAGIHPDTSVDTVRGRRVATELYPGLEIITPSGWGSASASKIIDIGAGNVVENWIRIRTTDCSALLTPGQGVFARYPDSPKMWVLYLGMLKGVGARLGVTNARALGNLAGSGESIWVLGIYSRPQPARAEQVIKSSIWGIPTITLPGGGTANDLVATEVFERLDTERSARRLLTSCGYRLERPHMPGIGHGAVRAEIKMFAGRPGSNKSGHELLLRSGMPASRKGLKKRRSGDSWFLHASRGDIAELIKMTEGLAVDEPLDLRVTGALISPMIHQLMPAAEVLPGMRLAVVTGDGLSESIVESVDSVSVSVEPVQLAVNHVHALSAGGILTSDVVLSAALY